MNGIPPLMPSVEIVYPSQDGEPMAETGIHVVLMLTLIATLRAWFRSRADVYVIGNIFLYYQEGDPSKRRSPDVMVIKGVPADHERDSFKVWQENAVPCVVIELTSNATAEEDQGPKKELYEQLGVREYFLFDPLGDYLPEPLIGYRLIRTSDNGADEVSQHYEELPPAADGSLPSAELGLRLVPQGAHLLLVNAATGQVLETPADVYERIQVLQHQVEEAENQAEQAVRQAEEAENQARQAVRQIEQAEKKADEARQRAEEAEKRLQDERRQREQLEQELARLRGLAPPGPLSSTESGP